MKFTSNITSVDSDTVLRIEMTILVYLVVFVHCLQIAACALHVSP